MDSPTTSTVYLEIQLLQNEAQGCLHHPRLSWSFSHSFPLSPQTPKCDFWAGAFSPSLYKKNATN